MTDVSENKVVMQTIERRAMEIVALPIENRAEHYAIIRSAFHHAALGVGTSEVVI